MKNLKPLFCLVIFVMFSSGLAKADQLAWLSKEDAEKGAAFLKTQKEIVMFCACCSNDVKRKVKILGVSIRHPKMGGQVYEEYYEVVIKMKSNGKMIEVGLDLAYVHIQKEGKAYCLGKELGLECDPCTEPFDWM